MKAPDKLRRKTLVRVLPLTWTNFKSGKRPNTLLLLHKAYETQTYADGFIGKKGGQVFSEMKEVLASVTHKKDENVENNEGVVQLKGVR